MFLLDRCTLCSVRIFVWLFPDIIANLSGNGLQSIGFHSHMCSRWRHCCKCLHSDMAMRHTRSFLDNEHAQMCVMEPLWISQNHTGKLTKCFKCFSIDQNTHLSGSVLPCSRLSTDTHTTCPCPLLCHRWRRTTPVVHSRQRLNYYFNEYFIVFVWIK